MKFLAVSTSQAKASVSYFENGTDIFTLEADRTIQPSFWLNEILSFFEIFRIDFMSSLDYIAVDIGPGSFTGIKVGLAFVKGISLGLNKPVLPVNSLEGFSYLAPMNKNIVIVSDAGKGLFYFSVYSREGSNNLTIIKPSLVEPERFSKIIAGYEKSDLYVIKDDFIKNIKSDTCFSNLPPLSKGIGIASRQSFDANKLVFASEITPLYIRVSDAEANLIKQS